MTNETSFADWFASVTTHTSPRRWQSNLAEESACRDRMIRIPTGLGKTEGVLATSAQLQAFRGLDFANGKSLRPCHTWWMSATLQPEWLKSVDTAMQHVEWVRAFLESLLRAADVRASRLKTNDPVFTNGESEVT